MSHPVVHHRYTFLDYVEIWRRGAHGTWARDEAGAGGQVRIESAGGGIAVDAVYRGSLEDI